MAQQRARPRLGTVPGTVSSHARATYIGTDQARQMLHHQTSSSKPYVQPHFRATALGWSDAPPRLDA